MRKITQAAVSAFYSDVNFKSGNTVVTAGVGLITEMKLHGNVIARKKDGKVEINNCGWETNTTKERLNGLNGVKINAKNKIWFLNGDIMLEGWNTI
ncbi:hypothetical protein N9043_01890 [bacterium]|nr:hypothetical protein [bacterium]